MHFCIFELFLVHWKICIRKSSNVDTIFGKIKKNSLTALFSHNNGYEKFIIMNNLF